MDDPPSPTGVGPLIVVCADEQDDVDIDAARWAALAEAVLRAEGVSGELTLTFVDPVEIAALERRTHGSGRPDRRAVVPARCGDHERRRALRRHPVLLGDVVVCPAVAAAAAPDHGGSVDDELALLVVHGILHVLGHDHAEPGETAAMRERERALLSEHHWHGPVPATFHRSRPSRSRASMTAVVWTTIDTLMLLAIVLLLLVLMFFAVAETSLNRISRVKAQAIADSSGKASAARALPARQSSGAVHQPDPRDDHVLSDRSGVPHVTARRPAVRRHRCHRRLLPERHPLLRAGRGDAEDLGGALRRTGRAGDGTAHRVDRVVPAPALSSREG